MYVNYFFINFITKTKESLPTYTNRLQSRTHVHVLSTPMNFSKISLVVRLTAKLVP